MTLLFLLLINVELSVSLVLVRGVVVNFYLPERSSGPSLSLLSLLPPVSYTHLTLPTNREV